MADPKVVVTISADASNLKAEIRNVDGEMRKFAEQAVVIATKLADVAQASGGASKEAKALGKELREAQSSMKAVGAASSGIKMAAGVVKELDKAAQAAKSSLGAVPSALARIGNAARDAQVHVKALGLATAGRNLGLVGAGITGGLGISAKDAADFDARMRNVQKITKETDAQFAATRSQVLNMPAASGIARDPRELAESLYQVRSANFAGADATRVMMQAQKLAAAGLIDTEQATLALTRSLRSYGAGAADAAFHSDVLLKVEQLGQVRGSELSAVWSNTATMASAAHIPIQQLGAAFATMTAKGMDANQASTDMISLMKSMIMPNARAVKSIEQINTVLAAKGLAKLDVSRAAIDKKGFQGVLEDIQRVSGGDPDKLKRILGGRTEAFLAFQKLMDDRGTMLGANLSKNFATKGLSGETEEALAVQRKSAAYHMQRLGAIFTSARISIGDTFLPVILQVADALGGLLTKFTALSPGIQQAMAWGAAAAGAIATVGGAALLLAGPILSAAALFAEGGAFAGALASAGGIVTGFGAVLAGLAWPITGAIAAIGALAAAWYNDWGGIREFAAETWHMVAAGFAGIVADLRPAAQGVLSFLSGMFGDIGGVVKGAMETLVPIFRVGVAAIGLLWTEVWGAVKATVGLVWPIVSGLVSAGLGVMTGMLKFWAQVFTGQWGKAWETLKSTAGEAWDRIKTGFSSALKNVVDVAKSFVTDFRHAGAALVRAFTDGMSGAELAPITGISMTAADQAYRAGRGVAVGSWAPSASGARGPSGSGVNIPAEITNEDLLDALKKHGTKPSKASAEEAAHRKSIVDAARSLDGLQYASKQCQIAINDVVGRAGFRGLGVTLKAFDQALLPRGQAPGVDFADRFYGADKLSRFTREPGQAKPGDLAFFTGTIDGYAKGVATHVGVVTRLLNGLPQIMHVSSAAGHKFVEAPLTGYLQQHLLGFGTLKAVAKGGGGVGDASEMASMFRGIRDYLRPDLSKFSQMRSEAQTEYLDKVAAAKQLGLPADVLDSLKGRLRQKLHDIADEEVQAKQDAEEKIRQVLLLGTSKTLEALQRRVYEAGKAISGAENEGLITPERAASARKTLADKSSVASRWITVDAAQGPSAEYFKEAKREQDAANSSLQNSIGLIQQKRELSQITAAEELDQIGRLLNASEASDAARMGALVNYSQKYRQYLQQQVAEAGESGQAFLEQANAQLQATDDQSLVHTQQMIVAHDMLMDRQKQGLLDWRQRVDQIVGSVGSSFTNFLSGIILQHQSFKSAFGKLWSDIASIVIQEIEKMIVKLTIMAALEQALGFIAGIFTFGAAAPLAGLEGVTPITSALIAIHSGGVVVPGGVQTFHGGGMPGFNLRPDEVLAKLQVGEVVLSRDMVRGRGRGGGEQPVVNSVSINIERFEAHHTDDVNAIADQLGRRIGWHLQSQAAYSS